MEVKKFYKQDPRLGHFFSHLGAFPVRRGVWNAEAFETARRLLKKGRVVAIFPEGGCSPKEGGYREARPGAGHVALEGGATILPIQLDNVRNLLAKVLGL